MDKSTHKSGPGSSKSSNLPSNPTGHLLYVNELHGYWTSLSETAIKLDVVTGTNRLKIQLFQAITNYIAVPFNLQLNLLIDIRICELSALCHQIQGTEAPQ
jgi:hypothetical protein